MSGPDVPKEPKPSAAYLKKLKDEYKAKKALEKAEPEPEVKPPEQEKGKCSSKTKCFCKCFSKPAKASRMVVYTMQTIADGKTKEDVEAAHEQMASKAAAAGFTSWRRPRLAAAALPSPPSRHCATLACLHPCPFPA